MDNTPNRNNITFKAWNMQCKFRTAKVYAKELCSSSDFLAVSEHGLYECEVTKLENIHRDYMGFGKSDKNLKNENFGKVKGYNGCGLLWRSSLNNRIIKLPELGSDRMCVVKMKLSRDIYCYIIAVYLPHQTCKIACFEDEILILEKVISECIKDGKVLIIGDENVSLSTEYGHRGGCTDSRNTKLLMNMLKKYGIICADLQYGSGPEYTYEKAGYRTYIDHAFVSEDLVDYIENCCVIDEAIQNVSDHLPISITLYTDIPRIQSSDDHKKRVAWNKLTPAEKDTEYMIPLETEMSKIIETLGLEMTHDDEGEVTVTSINDSSSSIPEVVRRMSCAVNTISAYLPQIKFNKALKDFWDSELKTLSKEEKAVRKEWVEAGKPRDSANDITVRYKAAKANFQRNRRKKEVDYETTNMTDLGNFDGIDSKFFWHLVRKHSRMKCTVNPVRNSAGVLVSDPNEIRKEWKNYYQELFSLPDEYKGDPAFKEMVENYVRNISETNSIGQTLKGGPFTVSEVNTQIYKLKCNKAPGWDEITAEHLKYSGPVFRGLLTWVYNEIVIMEDIPDYFKKGLIVSIPKPGKSYVIKENNRGITLLPVFYKVFEMLILQRESPWFKETLDELQGASQDNCSCQHTSLMMQEAISYNLDMGESVYGGLCDIMKAFDSVWIKGLLYKLHEYGIDIKSWKLIQNGYINFKCAAFVDGKPSEWFIVLRGVHQGAPLSMKLYQVFVNALLVLLKNSGFGLQLGHINVTCPASADDLAILSLNKRGLNSMMKIAFDYSSVWWFEWSMTKSKGLIWGKDNTPNLPIIFGNSPLEIVDKYKHLGIMKHNDKVSSREIISERIGLGRSALMAARGIGSDRIPTNPAVLNKIYWSICIPRMMYGVEVVPLTEKDVMELENAHKKNAKTVQNLPPSTPTPAIYSTLGWISMDSYITQVKILFLWKIAICLRDTIYFRVIRFIIEKIIMNGYSSARSPVYDTMRRANGLGIMNDVVRYVFSIDCDKNFLVEKSIIKKMIRDREYRQWKATCLMFSSLSVFREATNDISLNCWWYYVKSKPDMSKRVSSVIAVLAGSQPSGMTRNHGVVECGICGHHKEDVCHVLFDCNGLSNKRHSLWSRVERDMPMGLKNDISTMSSSEKTILLLSGFGNKFIREWSELYKSSAIFVHEMYVSRAISYDLMNEDTDA